MWTECDSTLELIVVGDWAMSVWLFAVRLDDERNTRAVWCNAIHWNGFWFLQILLHEVRVVVVEFIIVVEEVIDVVQDHGGGWQRRGVTSG